ncbi:MAG: carbohydrate ABC transporter permease [Candidatus Bipolaricaulia bacterium]
MSRFLSKHGYLMMLVPALLLYSTFVVWPLVNNIRYSFTDWLGIGPLHYIGIENYVRLLSEPSLSEAFYAALRHNLTFFGLTMAVTTIAGLGIALMLRAGVRGIGFYQIAYLLPYALSVVVVGFLWSLLLNPQWGLVNQGLRAIGLGALAKPWLGDPRWALPTVAFVFSWRLLGFPVLIFLAALLAIPDEYRESARLDGCNRFQEFFHVELPLLRPTFLVLMFLNLIASFNAFDIVFALEGITAGPSGATDLLATFFYRTAFGGPDDVFGMGIGMGAAIATLILIPVLVGSLVLVHRLWRIYIDLQP